ncbi:hypothetical protein EHS25_006832 [Saitozyma podzolica]|uniref:Ubiquitin-like domain-containing protein n=1 Tax=Saitozyma podzolica TaxID=1890683 RepID=A0A427XRN7_9TREE|nr:hypothetical protein EHS25_006832 [Saitozyma podzolica]
MRSVASLIPSNSMLIFVGTDFPGGRQFHLHLPVSASLAELKQAIWASARESIPPSDQYIQHASLPVSPILPLLNQGITSFSCVHLHHLSHLRRLEAEKAAAVVRDQAERGRYIDKAGRWKLRRRSRRKGHGHGHADGNHHDRTVNCAELDGVEGPLALPGFETLLTSMGTGVDRAVSVGTASPNSAHSWDLRGWTPP